MSPALFGQFVCLDRALFCCPQDLKPLLNKVFTQIRAWFKIRRFWVTQASGVALPVKAGLVSNAM